MTKPRKTLRQALDEVRERIADSDDLTKSAQAHLGPEAARCTEAVLTVSRLMPALMRLTALRGDLPEDEESPSHHMIELATQLTMREMLAAVVRLGIVSIPKEKRAEAMKHLAAAVERGMKDSEMLFFRADPDDDDAPG